MTSTGPGPDPTTRRLFLATAAVYVATIAYTLLMWDAIPDTVTTHVGVNGVADGFAPKTVLATLVVPLIGVAVSVGTAIMVPPPSLARANSPANNQTTNETLPFSQTATLRAELLTTKTQRMVAELLLFTSVVLSLAHLSTVFERPRVPFWVFIAALGLYLVWAVWRSVSLNRDTKADMERLQPDDAEQERIEVLKYKAGLGVYNEPRDPMAVTVLSSEPSKLQINSAHPAGKRQLAMMGVGLFLGVAGPLIIGFSV